MTADTQMQQAIAQVQSAAASMKAFAGQTQDQQAKKTFENLAVTLDSAVGELKQRQQYIQGQEPQYRQGG